MDTQMKQNLNRMVDRINSLRDEARKLRREASPDEVIANSIIAGEKISRAFGILDAINALVGCMPAHKMPEDIYLHF